MHIVYQMSSINGNKCQSSMYMREVDYAVICGMHMVGVHHQLGDSGVLKQIYAAHNGT